MNWKRYREIAATCLADVERLRDPGERIKLLGLAQSYLRLAEHVGNRQDRATAHAGDANAAETAREAAPRSVTVAWAPAPD